MPYPYGTLTRLWLGDVCASSGAPHLQIPESSGPWLLAPRGDAFPVWIVSLVLLSQAFPRGVAAWMESKKDMPSLSSFAVSVPWSYQPENTGGTQ